MPLLHQEIYFIKMPERLGPYKVLYQKRKDAYLNIWQARSPNGEEGTLYWFTVHGPEARAAFFRFRKALRAMADLGMLPKGVSISAKPGLYYVFWPAVNAPSALPAKGRKIVKEVGKLLAALAPLGYALPDIDLRLNEKGIIVARLDPLAEHDEAEALQLGRRFLKGGTSGRARSHPSSGLNNWLPGVLLSLIGIVLIILGISRYLNPPEFILPDLRGLTANSAIQKINYMGLKIVFSEINDPKKQQNIIIEQNPEPGTRIKPRHRLELFVNRFKKKQVPDLSNLSLDEAQQILIANGFQPAEIESSYSDKPASTVIATSPPAAAPLPQGTQIKILVSEGPSTQTTILPDLKGINVDDAKYLISVAELRLGDLQQIPSPEPEGTVLAQSPPAGSELVVGSPVTLTIATKAQVLIPKNTMLVPETMPPQQPESSETDIQEVASELAPGERIVPIRVNLPKQSNRATIHVRLLVKDENGSRTPIDTYAPVGTVLEGSVRVKGNAQFQLFLDDFLYQQWDSRAP